MDMAKVINKAAAFVTGALVVIWIGGSCGAAIYKTTYRLFLGAWPETALYGLAPTSLIRYALSLPREDTTGRLLLFLLKTDLLTYLLVVPPILLVPCVIAYLAGLGPRPVWRMAGKPFSTSGGFMNAPRVDLSFRRDRGLGSKPSATKSINNGMTRQPEG